MTIAGLIGSSERFRAVLEDVRAVGPVECAVWFKVKRERVKK
jgi:asparagine synthetase A